MESPSPYWWPRFLFQRGLGLVYLIAFLVAVNQFRPLLGERGLLPVPFFVRHVPFRRAPSLFYWFPTDAAFAAAAWAGVVLACLALTGISERYQRWFSALVWALLWVLYLSFVNVGQSFYAFGWESMLLEAGFYAIFLGNRASAPGAIGMWLLRWMLFRVMFGAGMIKLRGDPCWTRFTCLDWHFETQPMPNPLSWYFHFLPRWTHHAGVGFNHFIELAVPFGYFAPQPVAMAAGLLTMFFQVILMLSGNLSFLNLLTIVIAMATLDGRVLARWLPRPAPRPTSPDWRYASLSLAAVVAALSIQPALNLLSSEQVMNYSYNPLHLVNSYGAFGGVNRTRFEVIVEGTADAVTTPSTRWLAYEFKGKPGDPRRRPPQIAPYHLRLDWEMWFAAMSDYQSEPWFIRFVVKLLEGDRATLGLLASNPFPRRPPRRVRAVLYRYRFATPNERRRTGAWWVRVPVGPWFPEVSLNTPGLREFGAGTARGSP